jgi:hypothetical protein
LLFGAQDEGDVLLHVRTLTPAERTAGSPAAAPKFQAR